MSDSENGISAEEIVYLLRSEDADERRRGLDALDENGNGAALVMIDDDNRSPLVQTSKRVNPHAMFHGLLYLSQCVGRELNLELNWISTAPVGPQLVVPNADFRG